MPRLVLLSIMILWLGFARPSAGVETVQFRQDQTTRTVVGEILVEAQSGGLMLQADDGRIWTVQASEIIDRMSDDRPLEPIDIEQAARRMLEELGPEFSAYQTHHYLILYNCNDSYARQVGGLFEQLYRGFFAFWKNQRWRLPEPRFPLIAVVLKDHSAFFTHATAEIGEQAKSVIGYYNLATNHMTTFNVPNWERNVATLIHEATHQLAYNCALQTRFADNPMWVSEGLAMFFEAPDMRNPGRWRSIGSVNRVNLARWRKYEPVRPQESLVTLLSDNSRYQNPATATAAYAESWALTYFLIKTRREQYVEYLQRLSSGRPLAECSPRERIDMFEEAFETTLAELDQEFVAYMRRVRP